MLNKIDWLLFCDGQINYYGERLFLVLLDSDHFWTIWKRGTWETVAFGKARDEKSAKRLIAHQLVTARAKHRSTPS